MRLFILIFNRKNSSRLAAGSTTHIVILTLSDPTRGPFHGAKGKNLVFEILRRKSAPQDDGFTGKRYLAACRGVSHSLPNPDGICAGSGGAEGRR